MKIAFHHDPLPHLQPEYRLLRIPPYYPVISTSIKPASENTEYDKQVLQLIDMVKGLPEFLGFKQSAKQQETTFIKWASSTGKI